MQVLRIQQRRLRNEEWFNLFTEFKQEVYTFGPGNIGLSGLFDRFMPLYDQGDKLLEIVRKSSYTKRVNEADLKRDDLFSGLSGMAKSSQKDPDAAKKAAAERLTILLDHHHKLVLGGGFAEASAALYNLLQDLRVKYAADVTLLGLTSWVTALAQAEEEFLQVYDKRAEESAAKPQGDLRLVRRKTDAIYTAMINVLNSQLVADELDGDVAVDPESLVTGLRPAAASFSPTTEGNLTYNFVIAWNEKVKKYRDLLARRGGQHSKDDDPNSTDS